MDESYILDPPDVIEIPMEYKRDFEESDRAKKALRDIVAYPIVVTKRTLGVKTTGSFHYPFGVCSYDENGSIIEKVAVFYSLKDALRFIKMEGID